MNEFDMLAAAETARSGELPQNFWDDLSSGWRFRKEELAWPVDENGEKESGITIHLVNNEYDKGQILKQYTTPLSPEDSADDIARKVHALEYEHYPEVIEQLLSR